VRQWWGERWVQFHLTLSPAGAFLTTWLLCGLETHQWRCWTQIEVAASLVDLAVVLYGSVALTVERGVYFMVWAMDKIKKERAAVRKEAKSELLDELKSVLRSDPDRLDKWIAEQERENGSQR
jgi:hypothetical protein